MMRIKCYLDDLTPKLGDYYTIFPALIIRLSPYREYDDDNDSDDDLESKIVGWDLSFHFAFWQGDLVIGLVRNNGTDNDY